MDGWLGGVVFGVIGSVGVSFIVFVRELCNDEGGVFSLSLFFFFFFFFFFFLNPMQQQNNALSFEK